MRDVLLNLIAQMRDNLDTADEPKAKALLETSAAVIAGLKSAFENYEQKLNAAMRQRS